MNIKQISWLKQQVLNKPSSYINASRLQGTVQHSISMTRILRIPHIH